MDAFSFTRNNNCISEMMHGFLDYNALNTVDTNEMLSSWSIPMLEAGDYNSQTVPSDINVI